MSQDNRATEAPTAELAPPWAVALIESAAPLDQDDREWWATETASRADDPPPEDQDDLDDDDDEEDDIDLDDEEDDEEEDDDDPADAEAYRRLVPWEHQAAAEEARRHYGPALDGDWHP